MVKRPPSMPTQRSAQPQTQGPYECESQLLEFVETLQTYIPNVERNATRQGMLEKKLDLLTSQITNQKLSAETVTNLLGLIDCFNDGDKASSQKMVSNLAKKDWKNNKEWHFE